MSKVEYQGNTYAGNLDPEKMTPLLLPKAGIVERGLVTLKTGIKKRRIIRDLDVDVEFQNRSAKFKDDGLNIRKNESYLDPVGYEVMKELDWSDILEGFEGENLKAGSMSDYTPPADEEEFLLNRMAEIIGIANEELYINGKDSVTAAAVSFDDDYPGLLPRIEANAKTRKSNFSSMPNVGFTIAGISTANNEVTTEADHNFNSGDMVTLTGLDGNQQVNGESLNLKSYTVVKTGAKTFQMETEDGDAVEITGATEASTGKAVAINENNVIEVLSHVYRTTPRKIRNRPDFKMPVPDHVADAYKLALAKKAEGAGNYTVGDRELDFLSWKMEPMPYWQPNSVAAWNAGNVFLGLDLTSDEEFIKTVALEDNTLDQVIRYKAAMKSDINAKFFEEIYWARPK